MDNVDFSEFFGPMGSAFRRDPESREASPTEEPDLGGRPSESPPDPFGPFVFTASAQAEPPRSEPGSQQEGDVARKAKPKGRRIDLNRFNQLGLIAATLLLVAVLGGVAAWERMPKSSPQSSYQPLRFVRTDVLDSLPPHTTTEVGVSVPVPPSRQDGFITFDELPDYGGARTPLVGHDVDLDIIETRLRERLRREGKLPPEPGSIEELRDQVESAKDSFIHFVSEKGGSR